MIKHIVMFKFKKFAESNNKLGNTGMLKQYLEALPAKINEIKFLQVGVNFSDATVAYDLVLVSEFFSKEALSSYQKHPEHVKVADFVGKVCESRIVVDYTRLRTVMKVGVCGIACEVCPRMSERQLPQGRGRLPADGRTRMCPDCHLRFSKRRGFVLPVPGISLRDHKARVQ